MTPEETAAIIARLESENQSMHHCLKDAEQIVQAVHSLAVEMAVETIEIRHMNESLAEIKEVIWLSSAGRATPGTSFVTAQHKNPTDIQAPGAFGLSEGTYGLIPYRSAPCACSTNWELPIPIHLFHSADLQGICLREHHPSVYDETGRRLANNT